MTGITITLATIHHHQQQQQVFAEESSSNTLDYDFSFSDSDFDTGRFNYLPYGDKFYQYKYHPFGVLASESSSRCHFTADFVLGDNSPSKSGNVIYKFPADMIWPGGYDNSTFYIVRSPSFNFPEDTNFEKLNPTKSKDDDDNNSSNSDIVLEFELIPGLNTFVANSTAFWDSKRSQKIDCPNPFDFEKQEYGYYDFVYPLKVQQNYAEIFELSDNDDNENDFLCKTELIPVLKYNNSPACVKPETKQKLIERGWATNPLYDLTDEFIIGKTDSLEQVKLFQDRYQNYDIRIVRDSFAVFYEKSGIINEYGEEKTKSLQVTIDPLGNPLHDQITIACLGSVSTSAMPNVIELLETDYWCFSDADQ